MVWVWCGSTTVLPCKWFWVSFFIKPVNKFCSFLLNSLCVVVNSFPYHKVTLFKRCKHSLGYAKTFIYLHNYITLYVSDNTRTNQQSHPNREQQRIQNQKQLPRNGWNEKTRHQSNRSRPNRKTRRIHRTLPTPQPTRTRTNTRPKTRTNPQRRPRKTMMDLEDLSYYNDDTRRQIQIFTHDIYTGLINGGTGQ